MEVHLSERVGSLLQAVILLILPWIVIFIGLLVPFYNAWFYILAITWFGCGLVFYGTLN
jgi:hypothetical protein